MKKWSIYIVLALIAFVAGVIVSEMATDEWPEQKFGKFNMKNWQDRSGESIRRPVMLNYGGAVIPDPTDPWLGDRNYTPVKMPTKKQPIAGLQWLGVAMAFVGICLNVMFVIRRKQSKKIVAAAHAA